MEMINNKKGVYYTIVSIIIISLIIGFNNFDDNSRIKQKGDIMSKRAISMNNFLDDIEKDAVRMIKISGYRTLLSCEKYVTDNQDFIDDFDNVFFNIFFNGTYNGSNYTIMKDASMLDWRLRVAEESKNLNLNFFIYANDVWVKQISPWDIEIFLNATIVLSDDYNVISWNYTKIFSNSISIINFEDPLYKVKSLDKVSNLIIETNISDFINDSNNNSDNFEFHQKNSYYINSTSGPSFLMRFKGNLSPSPYGIESFVNLEDFSNQELPIYDDRSLIDYIYFNESSSADYCDFEGLKDWFRIDAAHLNNYELDKLNYTNC